MWITYEEFQAEMEDGKILPLLSTPWEIMCLCKVLCAIRLQGTHTAKPFVDSQVRKMISQYSSLEARFNIAILFSC